MFLLFVFFLACGAVTAVGAPNQLPNQTSVVLYNTLGPFLFVVLPALLISILSGFVMSLSITKKI
jgi:uncharacterized membrane protein AbrB (regulator of aidB expression)